MQIGRSSRRGLAALALAALAATPLPWATPAARADTFTVCPIGCAYSTIQAAVAAAVAQDQATGMHDNLITVGAGTYTGGISLPGDPTQPPGYRSFTLRANPHMHAVITGNDLTQVLTVFDAPTVNLQGFTIENGLGGTGGGIQITGGAAVHLFDDTLQGNRAHDGAGIYANRATLTITNTTFQNNVSSGGTGQDGHGGAIYATNSTVSATYSDFLGNTALGGPGTSSAGAPGHSGFGGGIFTAGGSLGLDATTFFGNRALGGTGGTAGGQGGNGSGGALYVAGGLLLTRSTLSGNVAQGGLGGNGGGAAGYGEGGAMLDAVGSATVANSSFTVNSADGNYRGSSSQYGPNGLGGALYNGADAGGLVLDNDTIAYNTLPHGGQGTNMYGPATVANTILAGASGGNCSLSVVDLGGNVQAGDASCGATIAVGDPRLGPLQVAGGPTQTMPLGTGSAAIGRGDPGVCHGSLVGGVDQRGTLRPLGRCDAGAYDAAGSTAMPAACPPGPASSAYAQAVLASGPVGYWRLDEGCVGQVHDASGNGRGGEAYGGVTPGQSGAVQGDPGTAMAFDGTSGFISLGDAAALQPAHLSVEAWIDTSRGSGMIVRKRLYGYSLALTGSGQPVFAVDDSNAVAYNATGPASVADGHWHHLVGTYDGGQVCLYVDGAQAACSQAGQIVYKPDMIAIGRDGGAPGGYFAGKIAEVAIYAAALSADQVRAHYAASLPATTTTLAIAPNPVVVGQPYALTANVRGGGTAPSGSVGFCFNGTRFCTQRPLDGNGTATLAFTAIQNSESAAGTYSVVAVYGGDASHAGSTSATGSEVFVRAQTGVTVTSGLNPAGGGQRVTLTAAVQVLAPGSGSPTGTITFMDGSTAIGSASIGLPLSITTGALRAGTHRITAVYSGDASFAGSTSSVLSQIIR